MKKRCKNCDILKEDTDFYLRRRVCKCCAKLKRSTNKKNVPWVGELRNCKFCDENLDISKFYGVKTTCIECLKENEKIKNSPLDRWFEPGALKEIHYWVLNTIVPELNAKLDEIRRN